MASDDAVFTAFCDDCAELDSRLSQYEEASDDLDALYMNEIYNEGLLFRCMRFRRLDGAIDNTLSC